MGILQVKCLRGMGSDGDALILAQRLMAKYPDSAELMELVASGAANTSKPGLAFRASLKMLELAPKGESPLLENYGIRHYVETPPMATPPMRVDKVGYFVTWQGQAFGINLPTGEVTRTDMGRRPVRYLVLIVDHVYAAASRDDVVNPLGLLKHRFLERLDAFGADRTPNNEQAMPPMNAQKAPPAQFFSAEDDGQVVLYRNAYCRPARGGRVRRLVGDEVQITEAKALPLRNRWRICLSADRPLGYDNEGVYELDPETLVPKSKLLAPPENAEIDHGNPVLGALVSDKKTLCRVTINKGRKDATIRVYSLDGQTVLREEKVECHESLSSEQVIPMWDGYMVLGDEMTWVPGGKEAKCWRFKIDLGADEGEAKGGSDSKRPGTAIPADVKTCKLTGGILYEGKLLYVGHADGGVFGFEMEQLKKLVAK
jgi:hypothetical protein